jgi:hypothetical protein
MATDEEKTVDGVIEVDSPAMRITFDLTAPLKDWTQQGLLTVDSTIAIGLVQRQADVVDDQGNPRFDDPNLYIHSQMVFEVNNAFLSTGAGGTAKGPGVFAEYDLIDGYVNTGDWMGWVEVTYYPWCHVLGIDNWVYAGEPEGWFYVLK